jgi:hypothetical protein
MPRSRGRIAGSGVGCQDQGKDARIREGSEVVCQDQEQDARIGGKDARIGDMMLESG